MSQQITSNSVYVFFAMGAARHILWPVTIDLCLGVAESLCVFLKAFKNTFSAGLG